MIIEYITNVSNKIIYCSLFKAEKKTRLKYTYYCIVQSQVKKFCRLCLQDKLTKKFFHSFLNLSFHALNNKIIIHPPKERREMRPQNKLDASRMTNFRGPRCSYLVIRSVICIVAFVRPTTYARSRTRTAELRSIRLIPARTLTCPR